eukprot:5959969-Amphidinium_carterae.3
MGSKCTWSSRTCWLSASSLCAPEGRRPPDRSHICNTALSGTRYYTAHTWTTINRIARHLPNRMAVCAGPVGRQPLSACEGELTSTAQCCSIRTAHTCHSPI